MTTFTTTRHFRGAVALALALPVLLFAACGGDGEAQDATATATTPASTSTASAAATTPAAGATTPATGPDATGDLRALALELDGASYRASYTVKSNASGGNLDGTLTLAAQPPLRMVYYEGKTPLGTGEFVIIEGGPSSYLCIKTASSSSCAQTEAGSAASGIGLPAGLSVTALVEDVTGDPSIASVELAGESIAGQEARCFQVVAASTDGVLCLGADGVPLRVDGEFQAANWTITATEVGAPSAADFKPPFAVTGG